MSEARVVEELIALYGRTDDPLWNARVRPFLEESVALSRQLGAQSPSVLNSAARILLARPDLAELAARAVEAPSSYLHLLRPAEHRVDLTPFADPQRFLTPAVTAQLPVVVGRICNLLDIDPTELLPAAPVAAELTPRQERACERVVSRLALLEPYAPLEGLDAAGEDERGVLLRPRYAGDRLVFGGAQYYVGDDGTLLCGPGSASLEDLSAAHGAGSRSGPATEDPEEADEVWARNSGPAARGVVAALEGDARARVPGVLGHWDRGQFVDGETIDGMLDGLGIKSPPPSLDTSSLGSLLQSLPAHAHVVVGVSWKGWNRAHWFNVRHNGAGPVWLDGQSGGSGSWPPPFLDRASDEAIVLRPPSRRSRRLF